MVMALREIRKYPDPVLRKKTGRIEQIDDSLNCLIEDMVQTMRAAPGVGLAANQVGEPIQLAVIDLGVRDEDEDENESENPHELLVIINPEVLSLEGSVVEDEGCLSIPEYSEKVKRAAKIRVRAQDRTGKPFEIEAEGLLAKALQHEIDHLNGLLYIDRLSPLKKNIFKRRHRRAQAEQE